MVGVASQIGETERDAGLVGETGSVLDLFSLHVQKDPTGNVRETVLNVALREWCQSILPRTASTRRRKILFGHF